MLTLEKFKKFGYILACIISLVIGYNLGQYDWYMAKDCHPDGTESIWYPHCYNTKEHLYTETKLCNNVFAMLHMYWQYKDYESYDENKDIYIGRHSFWYDTITETDSYQIADSIMGHDWEDFFDEW